MFGMTSISKSQPIFLKPGLYFVQLWGAQGGNGLYNKKYDTIGGKGAFVSAILNVGKNVKLFANIGSRGSNGNAATQSVAPGGWNGGGNGGRDTQDDDGAGAGGGATDLRLSGGSLSDRIMVAAGGSGSTARLYGAPGGDIKCYIMTKQHDPNSFSGNANGCGDFGIGQSGKADAAAPSSGAGGGYRGGKAVSGGDDTVILSASYSGSSFIAGYGDQDPMTELLKDAGISITHQKMFAGFQYFTSFTGGIEKGHEGDGCMMITPISQVTYSIQRFKTLLFTFLSFLIS